MAIDAERQRFQSCAEGGETGDAGILPFELQDLAVGDSAQFIEDGDVAASPECRLDAGVRGHVPIEQPVGQLRQRIRCLPPPLHAPMRMQWILGDQSHVPAIGAQSPGNTAFNSTIELQRTNAGCGMASNWGCKQVGGVGVAIVGVGHDHARLGYVGVAVREVGAGMVDVVRHPGERDRSVQLDVPAPERSRS